MKSILALLLLAVVANALTDKSGGLKGSWTEMVTLTSPDDTAAPVFDDGDYSSSLYLGCSDFDETATQYTLNTSDPTQWYYYCDADSLQVRFALSGELSYDDNIFAEEYSMYYTGGVTATYWSGASMTAPDNTIMGSCSIDYDNSVLCVFGINRHMYAGTYMLYITAWDGNGNWASYTQADFADDPTFILQENDPDVTAPVISSTLTAITGSPVALDGSSSFPFDQDVDGGSVMFYVVATDGFNGYYQEMPTTDANYDPMSSQVSSVWVTIQMGATATDDNTVMWMMMDQNAEVDPTSGDSDTDTGYWVYANNLVFLPVFEPGTWYVTMFTAMDYAGNSGTMTVSAADGAIVVTYDRTALDAAGGVFSCQTVTATATDGISDPAPTVTATDDDYIIVTAGCTLKGTAVDGYVGLGYQSDAYTPTGQTMDQMYTFWSEGTRTPVGAADSNWLMGMGTTYTFQDTDYSTADTYEALGTDTILGYWASSVYFAPAAPNQDYYLFLVLTITPEGGIQSYSLADGAASALAPSVFAVLIAAFAAMLRL